MMAKRKSAREFAKEKPATNAIQLKVRMRHIRPPIWRRVVVPDNATLGDLHEIIQIAMGWRGGHLHCFRIGERSYTGAEALEMDLLDMKNEADMRLADVATQVPRKFAYDYDFGDGWEHDIIVEKIFPIEPKAPFPICLGGKRACPPEDCGGYPGYANLLEALKVDPPTEDTKDLLEWLGGGYDPEAFDLDGVNIYFAAYRQFAKKRARA